MTGNAVPVPGRFHGYLSIAGHPMTAKAYLFNDGDARAALCTRGRSSSPEICAATACGNPQTCKQRNVGRSGSVRVDEGVGKRPEAYGQQRAVRSGRRPLVDEPVPVVTVGGCECFGDLDDVNEVLSPPAGDVAQKSFCVVEGRE